MPTIEHQGHDLTFRVLVMGAATEVFMGALSLEQGELRGHDIQGWHPHFKFEPFSRDPWATEEEAKRLEAFLPFADALVLNDAYSSGAHYSSEASERLRTTLGPTKLSLPTVIFGGPALAEEWASLSGVTPLRVLDPEPERAMDAVKTLAAALLRSRMRSTPPPPAVD